MSKYHAIEHLFSLSAETLETVLTIAYSALNARVEQTPMELQQVKDIATAIFLLDKKEEE